MKYLITGGCGFIGSNLAAEVLKRGEELFVLTIYFVMAAAQILSGYVRKVTLHIILMTPAIPTMSKR